MEKAFCTYGRFYALFLSLTFWVSGMQVSIAQLTAAKVFSDHMVFQREAPLSIWGWASPGEEIRLNFKDYQLQHLADEKGHWEFILPEQGVGGPYQLKIKGEKEQLMFSDVMIGDVWLCSGQSNMEWTVENSNDAEREVRQGNYPHIRHFKVPQSSSPRANSELAGGSWEVASSQKVGDFTAVGYFFAKRIHQSEGIPIGLLNSSWGGSRIEAWLSAEDLGYKNPEEMVSQLEAKRQKERDDLLEKLQAKLGDIPEKDLGMHKDKPLWAAKDMNDTQWKTMNLPGLWEQRGWEKTDGVFWFRKTILLGKGRQIEDGMLSLGPIDDSDQTWVNGHAVGSMEQAYNKDRLYRVPSKYLKEGSNTIVVRVEDTGGGGGIYGDPSQLYFQSGSERIPLGGEWKYKVGKVRLNAPGQGDNQQPTLLYNKMIHPLLKFPIKGVLWYQGESNAGSPEDAKAYEELFAKLISGWRSRWGQGDFPFLYVQLANFMAPKGPSDQSNWALLRESQNRALGLANTAQAIIIDLGEADDIHPRNKQDVGKRLSLAAQKLVYGKEVVFSGPVFRKMEKRNGQLILSFAHCGAGLTTKNDGPPKGFAIAGQDRKFIWADAKIEGNTVVVFSERVKDPVAVRYAWGDNPDTANLYNREELPAAPFRTDNWD